MALTLPAKIRRANEQSCEFGAGEVAANDEVGEPAAREEEEEEEREREHR